VADPVHSAELAFDLQPKEGLPGDTDKVPTQVPSTADRLDACSIVNQTNPSNNCPQPRLTCTFVHIRPDRPTGNRFANEDGRNATRSNTCLVPLVHARSVRPGRTCSRRPIEIAIWRTHER
jgi:hypothetical protein